MDPQFHLTHETGGLFFECFHSPASWLAPAFKKKELLCTFFVTQSVLKNAANFVRQQIGPPDTLTAQTDLESDADVRQHTPPST